MNALFNYLSLYLRHVFSKEQHQIARKSALNVTSNPQTAGYLSWEGISYFFGRFWTNGKHGGQISPPPERKLIETQGNIVEISFCIVQV